MKRRNDKNEDDVEEGTPEELMDDEENEDQDSGDDENNPPTVDPYQVLGLNSDATAEDVKKAYRKMALKHHPDKAAEPDKAVANKTFQEIAFAYAVLSDTRRRKRYDLTGSTAESLEDDDDFDWLKFYREQFDNVVNETAINKLSEEYKGSDEERSDLLKAYTKYKGNLGKIYNVVMLSDILIDDDRFREILNGAIAAGEVDSFPAYAKETDATREKAKDAERKSRASFDKDQQQQATDDAAKTTGKKASSGGSSSSKAKPKKSSSGGADSLSDLAALIQARQKSRAGGFFDHLEAKYAPKSTSKSKSKRSQPLTDEPPESAFRATAERAKKRKHGAKKVVSEDEDEEMDIDIADDDDDEEEEEEPPRKQTRGKARTQKGRGRFSSRGL